MSTNDDKDLITDEQKNNVFVSLKRKIESLEQEKTNRTHKKCICGRVEPSFGLPDEKIRKWCAQCPSKSADAIHLRKKCVCGQKNASYTLPENRISLWCINCPEKPSTAISIRSRKCECGLASPSYCLPGESSRKWCAKCPQKPLLAINTKNKKCECGNANASFSLPGETSRKWCAKCPTKPLLAICTSLKLCPCGVRPYFNLKGETEGKWCVSCPDKPDNAINVKSAKCECGLAQPTFNLEGQKSARWCVGCKPALAINVCNNKCEKCDQRATFGFPGQQPMSCAICRITGMVHSPRKRCVKKLCKELAIYGIHDRTRCEKHKNDDDFNLVEHKCSSCGLEYILNSNGLCDSCEPSTYLKYCKRKELRIKNLLDANGIFYVHDSVAYENACGKERPDFLIPCEDHDILLEVDENGHNHILVKCENVRMFNIVEGSTGHKRFFIRYNPDDFKLLKTKKKSQITQMKKEKHLLEWINLVKNRKMDKFGECIKLFYDGCDNQSFEKDIFEINMELVDKS